jgi:hypothetical protein
MACRWDGYLKLVYFMLSHLQISSAKLSFDGESLF